VAVTDHQVATLRAYLSGNFDEYERLYAHLDREADQAGYGALIAGGFFEAVDRRFAKEGTVTDVIEFVGAVRARSERLSESIDPTAAERLIRHSLGDGSIADLDDKTVVGTQFLLLAGLVADEEFDEADLDDFLAEARALGDRLMS
jgi:hypothetical protein